MKIKVVEGKVACEKSVCAVWRKKKSRRDSSAALLLSFLFTLSAVFAEPLDLAGEGQAVTDVSELAEYDGVTNSSGGEPVTLTFDISSDMEYAGKISGNIKLVKKGVGMLTLSGDNDYTGGTVIGGYDGSTYTVGGRLRANSLTAFGAASGAITVNSNCQQSNMASNKVTCVVFNVAGGTFAYPINTSVWPNPGAGPEGEGGKRQYNVAVTVAGVNLSGKIIGGGLSVHCGGLEWDPNASQLEKTSTEISGEIYCPNGTCHFGTRARTINITGKVATLGIYQTDGGNWPPEWKLSNSGNSIGVIDVGGGTTSSDRSLMILGENASGGSTIYSRSVRTKSRSVKIAANQVVESFSMAPNR
ncbi:MAG: autotransporter-associated beta strand repeat-containing protein, partial [Kiritimatiellae bacterium]|nr:autotransporter-associated beta strand repeat-containing protein [Kiritimatiellia bacterium]